MTAARRAWAAFDATVARIDAVLAEPEPASRTERVTLSVDAARRRPADVVVATVLAQHAYGGLVALPPETAPRVREYVAPPVETRPGFLGRLRRRLFGEPPQ